MSVCYIMGFVLIASTSRCAAWNQEAHWPPGDTVSQAESGPGERADVHADPGMGERLVGSPRGPLGRSPAQWLSSDWGSEGGVLAPVGQS